MENIKLRGAVNMRDLGCMRTADGRKIRNCMFLRGGNLSKLKKSDIKKLCEEYKLKVIIDLRTMQEAEEKPDIEIPGVKLLHLPLFSEATLGISREKGGIDAAAAVKKAKDKQALKEYIPDLSFVYPRMVTDEFCLGQIRRILSVIMENESGSVLFHCSAGKDRTGMTAMLLLTMLGVSREDIMADYLFSNRAAKKQANTWYTVALLFLRDKEIAEKARRVFSICPEYLQSAFDTIDDVHGSMDNFIHNALGITDEQIASFRAKSLE